MVQNQVSYFPQMVNPKYKRKKWFTNYAENKIEQIAVLLIGKDPSLLRTLKQ